MGLRKKVIITHCAVGVADEVLKQTNFKLSITIYLYGLVQTQLNGAKVKKSLVIHVSISK